jgi:hypothetical protein
LNVFIDIIIEFHHHFLIVTFLPCTPTYTFFFILYNDSLPNMLYHYVPFFPFPLIHSNFHTIYPYFSCLYIIPHSTFHIPHSMSTLVARSIAEPKFFFFFHFFRISTDSQDSQYPNSFKKSKNNHFIHN